MFPPRVVTLLACFLVLSSPIAAAAEETPNHGLSMFGDLKYKSGFTHFEWTNPDAPKGGTMKLSALGTFDSLNPFLVKGATASGLGYLFQTLMARSEDEPFAQYGLVADGVTIAPDRTSVTYHLRPEATFSDGSPITPEDVVWSFETLTRPQMLLFHDYYADVVKGEKTGDHLVKFSFRDGRNRELPLIIGELPVLSKAYWTAHDFDKTTLEPPVGNGPYTIAAVDPGRSITYRRVPNWWGANLGVAKGRFNVDEIRYDYYRDTTVALEAFKAGAYDVRPENNSKAWATGYDGPALAAGLITKQDIPNALPQGMQGYVFNTRRQLFADPLVRRALGYAFDFEWTNKTLFYGLYTRSHSYWNNSELGSSGLPTGAELAFLEGYRGRIPDAVFTAEYAPPKTDGSGNLRDNLKQALDFLKQAGWSIKGKQLVNDKTGTPFEFEILESDISFERVTLPMIQNLQRLGITARLRTVDTSQYISRLNNFDFDMTTGQWPQSASPGNEQRDFWSSGAADRPGSRNLAGVKNPAIDALIEQLITVPDYEALKTTTHALDRILVNGYYVIPQWYRASSWIAYWNKFQRPTVAPTYYPTALDSWWVAPGKDSEIEAAKAKLPSAPK
ncbi:MAG TPA: extracellular solute-binding protein [Stellaceae bacterium]|nr:extracellular solute-binding protein [Stellaceae bacterium]